MKDVGVYCPSCNRVHQSRERATRCIRCGVVTWHPHAVCTSCRAEAVMAR